MSINTKFIKTSVKYSIMTNGIGAILISILLSAIKDDLQEEGLFFGLIGLYVLCFGIFLSGMSSYFLHLAYNDTDKIDSNEHWKVTMSCLLISSFSCFFIGISTLVAGMATEILR